MTASSACNCKAIKGDPNPNGIESRNVAFQQMGYMVNQDQNRSKMTEGAFLNK